MTAARSATTAGTDAKIGTFLAKAHGATARWARSRATGGFTQLIARSRCSRAGRLGIVWTAVGFSGGEIRIIAILFVTSFTLFWTPTRSWPCQEYSTRTSPTQKTSHKASGFYFSKLSLARKGATMYSIDHKQKWCLFTSYSHISIFGYPRAVRRG